MKYRWYTIKSPNTNKLLSMNKLPKSHLLSKSLFSFGQILKILPVVILGLVSINAVANEFDQRQTIMLNEAQQAHVLTEMRSLLSGTQAIVAALAADDLQAVTQHARALGMSMKQKPENKLQTVLPEAFMLLGKSVHRDFDKIADDAERVKDPKHTLRQLSETLKQCQGCHESFRIDVATTVMDGQHSSK